MDSEKCVNIADFIFSINLQNEGTGRLVVVRPGFSSLSLNEPYIETLSFERTLNANRRCSHGSTFSLDTEDHSADSDSDVNEKYTYEENEKVNLTQTARTLELREYQKELAANALKGHNTIICAPTGSGKTRVATYIIQEHLKQSVGKRKKVAFLARVVALAEQQHKYLSKYLHSYKIALITGDSSDCRNLPLIINDYDIIVMTPMILENHIRSKHVPNLGVFSMLVFDECHHTRKGEPYNTLMHSYHKTKYEIDQAKRRGQEMNISLPKIVGLTASIGIEGAETLKDAMDNILKVCANLDALSMSTIEDNINELVQFVAVPTEEFVSLSERQDDDSVLKIIEIMQKLEKHMEKCIEDLQYDKLQKAVNERPANRKSQEYEQWTICTVKTAKTVPSSLTECPDKNISRRLIIITAMYLTEYRFALETYDLVELEDVMEYLEKSFDDLKIREEHITEENTFYTYFLELKEHVQSSHNEQNPNLDILANTLMKYLIKKSQDSRCIVFVRTRATSFALCKWLNKCRIKEIRKLNACSFTGANVSEEKGGTSPAKKESISQNFREGVVRLIVSTSVAEEGLDIPSCSLVIKYNHVGNEVTTVQSRGRSRAFGGVSILLAMTTVLMRERTNQIRAELMKKAIEGIRKMTALEFEASVAKNVKEIIETLHLADAAEQAKRKQVQEFEIVCSLCRKVSIESKNVRTIFEKYRVSIDRNLLKKIKIYRTPETFMDSILFVGTVKCLGEYQPGKKCLHPLGMMIKFKGIYFVTIGINKVAFNIGDNKELKQYKRWKQVPFFIEELSNDDTESYAKDVYSMIQFPDTTTDEDDSDTADDEGNEDGRLGDETNDEQQYRRRNSDTEVKKPY